MLDSEFEALWKKINARTTYRVEYKTDTLVVAAVKAVKGMEKIEQIRVTYHEAAVALENKGVIATMVRESSDKLVFGGADVIAYLQAETELTRSTLVRILKDSGRLADFFHNPQRFMDAVAVILKREWHRLIIDGIKYERIAGEEYSMQLFEGHDSDLVTYLHNRYELKNKSKSPYDAVAYDSEVNASPR